VTNKCKSLLDCRLRFNARSCFEVPIRSSVICGQTVRAEGSIGATRGAIATSGAPGCLAAFKTFFTDAHKLFRRPIKNGCNRAKAKALREILQYMGWLELVDEDYCFINHVAQRWSFTEQFPKYEQYIREVGEDTVTRIKSSVRQEAG